MSCTASNREYRLRNKLPLQFIMGIATTAAIQQQLHHRTSVCLATKSFQSLPSVVLLNHLIEKLFMRDSVMRVGPRLMQLLLDGFLYHDLSLNSFLLRIHLIVMQHYISLPMATLCCSVSQISVCASPGLVLFNITNFAYILDSS
jgi:origin recognition complex subunit 3